jgi:gamma-glutamyltranspeptidase/glutathione hydrolase
MKRIGGPLRYDDMAAHESEWLDPACTDYRGHDVCQLGPNTQGLAVLQMLQVLNDYDLGEMPLADVIHLGVEAKRLAFEDRAKFYADPAFADLPLKELVSEAYNDARAEKIRMDTVMTDLTPGDPAALVEGDTTYLSVADENGMMVSLIQSNYRGMGSGLVPDGLGFMFQDRGQLFHLDPDHANAYEPGKRPFHTIIPGFVMKDGAPYMSFGLMGGQMQPQGHVQMLVNIIDRGMNVQEAGDAARWQHFGSPEPTGEAGEGYGRLEVESGMPAYVIEALREKGHNVVVDRGGFGGYQMIKRDPETGVYWGATEMRKDGAAIGY